MKSVAIICAPKMEKALTAIVLSQNLLLSGTKVTTFNSTLYELRKWFPAHSIAPYPATEKLSQTLDPFDKIIVFDHPTFKKLHFEDKVVFLDEKEFDQTIPLLENIVRICQDRFSLPYCEYGNGLVIPPGLTWRAFPQRVILHPTNIDPARNWPAEKFIKLSGDLKKEGYDPFFYVAPEERRDWLNRVPPKQLLQFSNAHALGCFLFESGSLIGNNTSLDHFASTLNIPTISLFAQKSTSPFLQIRKENGIVVTPPNILPGARLKQKYWQKLLSVKRVLHAYKKLNAQLDCVPRI